MMHITFSPQRDAGSLSLSKAGDVLTINGQPFDFGALPDGGELPEGAIASPMIAGLVRRIGGQIHITLTLPLGPNPSPAAAFPDPITVTSDGPIGVP